MTRHHPVARRWQLLLATASVASLAAVGLVPTASQAQATVCTGEITSIIVPGGVEVPSGEACSLTNVLVAGDIAVGDGADLFLTEVTVSGALTVGGSGFAQVTDSTIADTTTLLDAFGLLAEGSTLAGGVEVEGGLFFSTGSSLTGSVVSSNGWTLIEAGQVSGNVTTDGDQATDLFDVSMAGHLSVTGATTGSVICQSTISGTVSVAGSGGVIQIGGEQPTPACGSNVITGGITLTGNNAFGITVSSNLIIGGLSCSSNSPSPAGSDNLVIGTAGGQCAGFGGAGVQSTAGTQQVPPPDLGDPDERRQAILQTLNERGAR